MPSRKNPKTKEVEPYGLQPQEEGKIIVLVVERRPHRQDEMAFSFVSRAIQYDEQVYRMHPPKDTATSRHFVLHDPSLPKVEVKEVAKTKAKEENGN